MLKIILDNHILLILMGVFTILGVVSKCIANITLKKLVKAAGNMNKSTHPLMRLVKAKFEHACLISDKVQNVEVFVDKFLYEYKVVGMKLHNWRHTETIAVWLCVVMGAFASIGEYMVYGMTDEVIQNGALGVALAIFLYLFSLTSDEDYQLEATKNYMIDYLENVCAHRYEKAYQKEIKVMEPKVQMAEKKTEKKEEKTKELDKPEVVPVEKETPKPEITQPTDVPKPEIVGASTAKKQPVSKEVLIREILEEFLA